MSIKGFAVTPVLLGRVSIGEVVENNGRRLPNKLDHILITGQVQQGGEWVEHPAMKKLLAEETKNNPPQQGKEVKLRSIPVRILFDRPENNFRAEYSCFDDKSRPVCSGDGEKAKRRTANGIDDVACPGADICEFGQKNRCKQFGRLIIGLEDSFENDPLAGFIFRTTGFNSIRALSARLSYFAAATGNKMAGMPCQLRIRAKSTAASYRAPIYYVDLEPTGGFMNAVKIAQDFRKAFEAAGLNRDALEEAVAKGMAQSAFFEDQGDGEEVCEEFVLSEEMGEERGAAPAAVAAGDKGQELCTPEQVAAITVLLQKTEMTAEGLFDWLNRPSEDGCELEALTADEAGRSIQSLQAMLEKKSQPASSDNAGSGTQRKPRTGKKTAEKAEEEAVKADDTAPVPPAAAATSNRHASTFF